MIVGGMSLIGGGLGIVLLTQAGRPLGLAERCGSRAGAREAQSARPRRGSVGAASGDSGDYGAHVLMTPDLPLGSRWCLRAHVDESVVRDQWRVAAHPNRARASQLPIAVLSGSHMNLKKAVEPSYPRYSRPQ